MELRQLEYLVAVAEEANFTRAAERVHISQSGVSAQIRQLERELGATLIDRSSRTATVTAPGDAALEHARAVLSSVDALRRAVDDVTGLIRGKLVIGMIIGCAVTPLFEALAAFRRSHPGIEVSLREDNSDRLVESVRSGSADVALIGAAGAAPDGFGSLPVVSEPLVAAVPPEHPLAARRRVSLDDLIHHPIVCLPQGTGIRTVFDRACAARGVRPDVALEASAPSAVIDLAVRGLGIAILSQSMITVKDGLTALPIRDAREPAVLALIWTDSDNPARREFVHHARRAFGRSVD